MPEAQLTHQTFWDRMDRATRRVGSYPEWLKGSRSNERTAESSSPLPPTPNHSDQGRPCKQDDIPGQE